MDVLGLLRPVYAGRRVLLVCGPVQSKTETVATLRSLGAAACLVIGSTGTGPLPETEHLVVDGSAPDLIEEFRRWERIADSPPPEVAEAVDRFAPDLVLTNSIESSTSFAGRPIFGARRAEWTALEDKTAVDAWWDDAGISRAPSEVTAVERSSAWAAHRRLDRGAGTVWAGDSRDGWHGGAKFVLPVRSAEDADRAVAKLAEHCDRLRVMPFLDGLPCSIHGVVTGDAVAALRPVEMVVLRGAKGFVYAGVATTWDPAPADREAMRAAARLVGARLRERVGFRGCFTIDGIMTADGFLPTELNPRVGGGLRYLGAAWPELPLVLLQAALVEGAVALDAAELERAVLAAADGARLRACQAVIADRDQLDQETHVDGDLTMVLGPSPLGAFLRITAASQPPPGEAFGPTAVRALALADQRWSLGLGPLTPAPTLR